MYIFLITSTVSLAYIIYRGIVPYINPIKSLEVKDLKSFLLNGGRWDDQDENGYPAWMVSARCDDLVAVDVLLLNHGDRIAQSYLDIIYFLIFYGNSSPNVVKHIVEKTLISSSLTGNTKVTRLIERLVW